MIKTMEDMIKEAYRSYVAGLAEIKDGIVVVKKNWVLLEFWFQQGPENVRIRTTNLANGTILEDDHYINYENPNAKFIQKFGD